MTRQYITINRVVVYVLTSLIDVFNFGMVVKTTQVHSCWTSMVTKNKNKRMFTLFLLCFFLKKYLFVHLFTETLFKNAIVSRTRCSTSSLVLSQYISMIHLLFKCKHDQTSLCYKWLYGLLWHCSGILYFPCVLVSTPYCSLSGQGVVSFCNRESQGLDVTISGHTE